MIIYTLFIFVVLLLGVLAITDKFNPALQFSFITGLGFLFLYDEDITEEGEQITFQLMVAVVLITITYIKPNAGNIT